VFVCISPGKAVPEMTYTVSGGTLNPTYSLTTTRCTWEMAIIVESFAMCQGNVGKFHVAAIWSLGSVDFYLGVMLVIVMFLLKSLAHHVFHICCLRFCKHNVLLTLLVLDLYNLFITLVALKISCI